MYACGQRLDENIKKMSFSHEMSEIFVWYLQVFFNIVITLL